MKKPLVGNTPFSVTTYNLIFLVGDQPWDILPGAHLGALEKLLLWASVFLNCNMGMLMLAYPTGLLLRTTSR